MAEIVEGDWKNFVFKMLKPDDIESKRKVYEHLRKNFYNDEPICNYFGGCTEEGAQEFEAFYETVIPDNLSFFAEDKNTKEIAAVRMTLHNTKATDFSKLVFKSKQVLALFKVVIQLDTKANFLERMGIEEYVNFVTASTDRKYRGQELTTEMYRRSISLLKAKGHVYVKSVLSSPWTQRALATVGFAELLRIYYKEFLDEDGKPMFPNMPSDSFCNFMYLKL